MSSSSSVFEHELLYETIGDIGELGIVLAIVGAILTSCGIILQKVSKQNTIKVLGDDGNSCNIPQSSVFSSNRFQQHAIFRNVLISKLSFLLPNINNINWNNIYYSIGITYVCLGFVIKLIVNMMLPQSTIALLSAQSIVLIQLYNMYDFTNSENRNAYMPVGIITSGSSNNYVNTFKLLSSFVIVVGIIIGICGANIHDGIFSLHDSLHLIVRVDTVVFTFSSVVVLAVLSILFFVFIIPIIKKYLGNNGISSNNCSNNNNIYTNDNKLKSSNPFDTDYSSQLNKTNNNASFPSIVATATSTSTTTVSKAKFLLIVLLCGISSAWLNMLQKTGMETVKYNHMTSILHSSSHNNNNYNRSSRTASGSTASTTNNNIHSTGLLEPLNNIDSNQVQFITPIKTATAIVTSEVTESILVHSSLQQQPQQQQLQSQAPLQRYLQSHKNKHTTVVTSIANFFSLLFLTACIFLFAFIKFRLIRIGLSMNMNSYSSSNNNNNHNNNKNNNSSDHADECRKSDGDVNNGMLFLPLYEIASILSNAFCGIYYLQEMNISFYSTYYKYDYYSSTPSSSSYHSHHHQYHHNSNSSNNHSLILYSIGLVLICTGILLVGFFNRNSTNSSNASSNYVVAAVTNSTITNPSWSDGGGYYDYYYNNYFSPSKSKNNKTGFKSSNNDSYGMYQPIDANDADIT